MAEDRRQPASESFVVKVGTEGAPPGGAGLEAIGRVEPLGCEGLTVLRVRKPDADARQTWRRIVADLPEEAFAAPVLLGEGNEEHFPTGRVTVRFAKARSTKALRAFAGRHGLRLERVNELVPDQATFLPARPRAAYLPDLIDAIAREPAVAAAWAETVSAYRRG